VGTLTALCTPRRTEVLLVYPTHRFCEDLFFDAAREAGFAEVGWPEELEAGVCATRLIAMADSE